MPNPTKLVTKLMELGLRASLCNWILNFLIHRPQYVQIGRNTSRSLTISTGAPQGCVFSPLLYSLYTHDCVAGHSTNSIVTFANDTTAVGRITDGDESECRSEIDQLTKWCQHNNLALNISKTKELIVDFGSGRMRTHNPVYVNRTMVERVKNFKFLGVHISKDLSWTQRTDAMIRKTHQHLYFLRRLRRFGVLKRILLNFYRCTVQTILTGCIMAWFGNLNVQEQKRLQKVVNTAQSISDLTNIEGIYRSLPQKCRQHHQRPTPSWPSTHFTSAIGKKVQEPENCNVQVHEQLLPYSHQTIKPTTSHKL
ncbi:uncharacterized protein LOC129706959 [Leucoraja erinacea]|uniref:uncharacterized protein LOC129706959 n=1 Tax=Leucoraja erinaceus TaxID=7782 RepID=UPI002458219A|nr:uncharacterized protein LOC129706959 [Leucoraja erinacea]